MGALQSHHHRLNSPTARRQQRNSTHFKEPPRNNQNKGFCKSAGLIFLDNSVLSCKAHTYGAGNCNRYPPSRDGTQSTGQETATATRPLGRDELKGRNFAALSFLAPLPPLPKTSPRSQNARNREAQRHRTPCGSIKGVDNGKQ